MGARGDKTPQDLEETRMTTIHAVESDMEKTVSRRSSRGSLGRTMAAVGLSVFAVAFAKEAHAQQVVVAATPAPTPVEDGEAVNRAGGMVGGIVGFGAHTGTGFSFGAEGGYTFPFHLYLGGNFSYFVGSNHVSAYVFEPQVGYDLAVSPKVPILIRPYVGLGYENIVASACGSGAAAGFCASASFGGFVLSPGVLAAYFFTPHLYAGVDVRIDVATASGSFVNESFYATGGYKF